ncbi:aminomethyltransferase family protein [Amycolatopsis endophytica]|uniref:Glycine cleavage system aminomethyltransferase T n=1 Tax=Amycolatopsis endophytica TaxID=860233 RepID=A0A853B9Z4_9PSEU|nr:aminomethyl transferase family protein [Amycolatopsis endophytica]NYI91594.1 glycine cleavage system aminomethyltransferase T [Amycolatopsis endophytica]
MPAHVQSLQDLLDRNPDLVGYFYHDSPGLNTRAQAGRFPIPAEFSNWRDEQIAWRESAVLFNQTHHMPELFVTGPDARALLNRVGVNSFANLAPGRAKQFVGCTPEGYVIGDCILYPHGDDSYELVSSMPLLNWIEYQAGIGGWKVDLVRDNNTAENTSGRRTRFRYQLDGPHAAAIFEKAAGAPIPDPGLFRTFTTSVAGVELLVLRHGMAGRHKAYEISGPYAAEKIVHEALLRAGEEFGLVQGGMTAYYSATQESGWIAGPVPAIYTSAALREYREWLPADGWEGRWQLAGSFRGDSIADYYTTPFDLGYGKIVTFDHDFIGREALERMDPGAARRKVTLVWNRDDVLAVLGSLLEEGTPAKFIDFPLADYATLGQRDQVLADGEPAGLSTFCGYSANERRMLSLAMVDPAHAEPGTEVVVLWGEPGGGSRKPRVERHRQVEVRATVAPVPFAYSAWSTGGTNALGR